MKNNWFKLISLILVLILGLTASVTGTEEEGSPNENISLKANCQLEKYKFQDSAENEDAPKIPVCRDFIGNLKALGEPPMVCDRRFHPKFKQFTWPKWTKLDPWENRDLIYQIWEEKFRKANDPNYPYAKDMQRALNINKQNLKKYIDTGDLSIAVTRVQIDDKPTDLLQFVEAKESFPCTDKGFFSSGSFGRQHYIVDMSSRKINFKATETSMQFGLYGNANGHYADLFLYKGLPYAAFWDGDSENGTMVIKGGFNDYCFIEYKTKNQKGEKK